jgi:hypothetical protein
MACYACRRQRKTQDVVHKFVVTLDEMYNGATRKLALNRHIADKEVPAFLLISLSLSVWISIKHLCIPLTLLGT